jgi:hypothetical protein
MIELNLGSYSRSRIWMNGLSHADYEPESILERRIPVRHSPHSGSRSIMVELFKYVGPRDVYGLLGAGFIPEYSGSLLMRVFASDNTGGVVDWALAGGIDDVHLGLPLQYAQTVLETAVDAAAEETLGPGVLSFDRAAHGLIGSSNAVFRHLTRVIVQLLEPDRQPLTEAELMRLIELPAEPID